MAKKTKQRAVILSANNAIFYGYTSQSAEELVTAPAIRLERARWVYYWRHPKNLGGLATDGPQDGSRIGEPVTVTIQGPARQVTEVTSAAAKAWDAY